MKKKILELDKKYLWHPFTPIKTNAPIPIASAKNEFLYDVDGKKYVDLISSWWVNIHGHCNEYIYKRIIDQSKKLEQVLFAGFTHEPAVKLAEALNKILPKKISKVFYSDNGSTSVEIALKIAIQYWYNRGKKKNKFISFDGGYHGDTFGAMSVGSSTGFYKPFEDLLPKSFSIPFPESWNGNNEIEKNENLALDEIDKILNNHAKEIAAVILEPLIQGAGGMKICRKEFLEKAVIKFKSAGVIVIFDEVMTAFGRTGKMFALDYLEKIEPDIVCLAKSLTGGYIPLAATVFNERIFQEFASSEINKTFLHGHSFTANPIGCEAALASLDLFRINKTFEKIDALNKVHISCLDEISLKLDVSKIRCLGSIAAFDLNNFEKNYGSEKSNRLKNKFLDNGLLLRPLGNTIYIMPPYCISPDRLKDCYKKIIQILN